MSLLGNIGALGFEEAEQANLYPFLQRGEEGVSKATEEKTHTAAQRVMRQAFAPEVRIMRGKLKQLSAKHGERMKKILNLNKEHQEIEHKIAATMNKSVKGLSRNLNKLKKKIERNIEKQGKLEGAMANLRKQLPQEVVVSKENSTTTVTTSASSSSSPVDKTPFDSESDEDFDFGFGKSAQEKKPTVDHRTINLFDEVFM